MRKIYLASASPRRAEILRTVGIPFEQKVSTVAESLSVNEEPVYLAEALALAKARDVADKERDGLVIGADTIVVLKGQVLGKPKDQEDALRMLQMLNGTRHEVISGVAVVDSLTGQEKSGHEVTEVTFRSLSEEQLRRYVATGEPMDKAGAYGIQGIGALCVQRICGCYNNVVGLPLTLLAEILEDMGFDVWRCIRKEERRGGET